MEPEYFDSTRKKEFDEHSEEYQKATPLAQTFLKKAYEEFAVMDIKNSKTLGFPSTDITIHLRTDNPRKTIGDRLNELFKEVPNKEKRYLTIIHGPIYEKEHLRCCLLQLPQQNSGHFTAIHFICKPEENPETR